MAAQNESNVAGVELERVLPKVQVIFEREDKFFSSIQKRNVEKISNRQMRVPLELRPGGNFQYFNADGGDLGRGGAPQYDKAVLNSVFMSENIEYTKLTEWATDDSRKAVVNTVRRNVSEALDEIRRQLDAQMQQPGNGVVGTISAYSTAGGTDTYTLASDGFGARLVRFGQTIQVWDAALTAAKSVATGTVITMHDTANKQINVTPAVTGAGVGDVLVVMGLGAPSSLPGLFGVPYHHSNASTGTWLGFSRAATPEVRANRVNGQGAALALPLPRLAINMIGNRVGIDNNFNPVAWSHPCQAAAYENIGQLVTIIQKGTKDEALNMYFGENMQLAGASLKTTFNWNQTRIDFINADTWGRGEILPLGFYKTDGRNIFEIRGASGGVATAEIFYMVIGTQTFVTNPAACAYIDNLAVPAGY